MKFIPSSLLSGVLALLMVSPIASLRAGTVVASDHQGGYGYAYGPYRERQLREKALRNCRAKSRYPDDVEVVFETPRRGAGIIIRYYVGRQQQIACVGGAEDGREAFHSAMDYVRDHDGRQPRVVERWSDD